MDISVHCCHTKSVKLASALGQGFGCKRGDQLNLKQLKCLGNKTWIETYWPRECWRLQQRKVTAVASKERIKHLWCVACLASRHLKGRWAPLPQCPEDFKLIFNPLRRRVWPGATVILHHVSHDSHLSAYLDLIKYCY